MTRKRHTGELSSRCRRMPGFQMPPSYKWPTKYAGLEVSDVKKLCQLEEKSRRLTQMMAEQALDIQALQAVQAVTAMDVWAGQHGVQLHFFQPGKPVQNAERVDAQHHWG
jgi:hypothetical protein